MLILSEFQILNANLWSIYSKRFEFMVYTFICAFWEVIFFQKNDGVLVIFSFLLLRPSKSSGVLKKDPTFGFLTFEYALKKTRPWVNLFKNIVLHLMKILLKYIMLILNTLLHLSFQILYNKSWIFWRFVFTSAK